MKIAILADIKANESALLAVLSDLARHQVERIWVIGSLLSYGPDPVAVVDLVRSRMEAPCCLLGHPDLAILSGEWSNFSSPYAQKSFARVRRTLRPEESSSAAAKQRWRWLTTRVVQREDEWQFFSCTPLQPEGDFLPIHHHQQAEEPLARHFSVVNRGAFVGSIGCPGIVFADSPIWQQASGSEARVELKGRRFIACPGAVGQPRDRNPQAAYAICDGDTMSWHRVSYDIGETMRRIKKIPDFPGYYAERLELGV